MSPLLAVGNSVTEGNISGYSAVCDPCCYWCCHTKQVDQTVAVLEQKLQMYDAVFLVLELAVIMLLQDCAN